MFTIALTRARATALVAAVLAAAALSAGLAQPVPYRGVPGGPEWLVGDFAAAYQAAAQVDSVAAQLLASRAASDQAVYHETEADAASAWLTRAEAAALRSLELEPGGPLAAAANMALARAKGEAGLHRGEPEVLVEWRVPGDSRLLLSTRGGSASDEKWRSRYSRWPPEINR